MDTGNGGWGGTGSYDRSKMVKKSSPSPVRKVSDSASTIMARAQDASDRILLNSYLLIGADIVS